MSEKEMEIYEFGQFRLNVAEHFLVRTDSGERVHLRDKAFETLCILVRNGGRLMQKNELLNQVWADSFVEENNLNKSILTIRRALGETPDDQQYIETVKKHGFRFVAEVRRLPREEPVALHRENRNEAKEQISLSPGPGESTEQTAKIKSFPAAPNSASKLLLKYPPPFIALALASFLICTIALGGWFVRGSRETLEARILSAPFASEKLSTNGKVHHVVISPDGKNVIYTNISPSDKRSIWLRHLETGNNIEIIPPSDNLYFGLAFSPDGNFLYFARRLQKVEGQLDIYRISVFGGIPKKIVSDAQGWMSISPDGARISFVRCPYRDDEYCSLWIADSADGRNEKKLVSRPRPFQISDNEFSPDGGLIAFATGQSQNKANEFSLSAIEVLSGAERELTAEKFFNIKGLAWLPDKSGLLITASRIPNKNFRIWHVSAATGEAEPLTKDSETYSALSLDKTASRLVATKVKEDFRVRVLNLENPSVGLVLADAGSVTFAPDGKIVYSSTMSGNDEIWSINPDGDDQKQLTNDPADDESPIIAPDNSAIYFASNRTGAGHVWRMNPDGSNQTQLTRETGGFPLFVSPNGEWVYFQQGVDRTLWRVSIRTGAEQMVLNKAKYRFALSPDGALVSFGEKFGGEKFIVAVSLANGETVKTFKYADQEGNLVEIDWLSQGEGLVYILADGEYRKNTLWLQPFDAAETPRKIADLGDDQISGARGLALAPDGKSFAVVQGGWLHDAVLLNGLK